MNILKKDGTLEDYDEQKIIVACSKAAERAMVKLSTEDYITICNRVIELIYEEDMEDSPIPVFDMHTMVVKALMELYPEVGQAYSDYRNYKLDFVKMLDDVYKKSQSIRYIGDVSNANSDAALVSTQRSLIYGELNKNLYKKFFLNKKELQAINEGFIYIHDAKDRLDTANCCLFDMENVMRGGFEMGNLWYNEPKTLDVAFDVMGDIILGTAAQQYGGFTVPEVDKILEPYANKSYQKYFDELTSYGLPADEKTMNIATEKVRRDFEQGWQGIEYKLNSVASSRGDYPFITMTFGLSDTLFGRMSNKALLKVHQNGQGKEGFKKPVLFPKLVFLYDEALHGDGSSKYPCADVFKAGIECSSKTMYPDWLSLTGNGYVSEMYKKYKRVVSPMGKIIAHVKLCELLLNRCVING